MDDVFDVQDVQTVVFCGREQSDLTQITTYYYTPPVTLSNNA
jgi:hypothetical protein